MKKSLAVLIITAMLISLLSTISFAAQTVNITVTDAIGAVGDEIEIKIDISENSNIVCGNFTLNYDSDRLEYVSHSIGNAIENTMTAVNTELEDQIILVFLTARELTAGGNLISIKFKILSNITDYIETSLNASELLTLKNEEVGSNIHNGSIKVDINKTMEKADINQDGKIDKADSKLIEDRILNKSSSEIDADLNLDKKIDVTDLVMLNEIIKIMSES